MAQQQEAEPLPRNDALPPAVLAHILQYVPYKWADARLVCRFWQVAVDNSLLSVSIPSPDCRVISKFPSVQHLTLGNASAAVSCGSSSTNPWSGIPASTLQRLKSLQLKACPAAFTQLAEWRAATNRSGSLAGLQQLHLSSLDCRGPVLPQLLCGSTACLTATALQPHDNGDDTAGQPLQDLQLLSATDCQFSSAADELQVLQQLPSLHTLKLPTCGLSAVPSAVWCATGLTHLDLSNNTSLRQLPQQLSCLTHLQVLNLAQCRQLRDLGPSLSCLGRLTELDLSGTHMWSWSTHAGVAGQHPLSGAEGVVNWPVPLTPARQLRLMPGLSALSSLHKLVMADNHHLCCLPASLSGLTGLEVLDVRRCSLRYLEDGLWCCVGLRELLLGDTVLDELPEEVSRLQRLQVLDLGHCHTLWRLPMSLLSLSQLTRLVVTNKALDQGLVERLELRCTNPIELELTDPGPDPEPENDPWEEWVDTSDELELSDGC